MNSGLAHLRIYTFSIRFLWTYPKNCNIFWFYSIFISKLLLHSLFYVTIRYFVTFSTFPDPIFQNIYTSSSHLSFSLQTLSTTLTPDIKHQQAEQKSDCPDHAERFYKKYCIYPIYFHARLPYSYNMTILLLILFV